MVFNWDLSVFVGFICNVEKVCNFFIGLLLIVYIYLSEGNLVSVRGCFGVFLFWLFIFGVSFFNMVM